MDTAAAGEQRSRIHRDHLAARVLLGQDGNGVAVMCVAESAGDDAAVNDEMVDIAVVDEPLGIGQRCGSWHLGDLPRAPGRIMTGLDGGSDPLAHLEVGMGFVTLGVQQQSTGSGDRGDDVHVPPRAEPLGVPRQTLRQPDRVGGAEGAGQLCFHLLPRHARVAAEVELHGVGDEYRALTVDLHAPALVDHVRVDDRHPRRLGDDPADVLIQIPLRPPLGTPPVEHPVHRGHRPIGSMHEGRPDIPHPGVIQRRLDDLDAVR